MTFWPKVLGTGNVAAATSPAPSFSVLDPLGVEIASGTPTATTIDSVTRFRCTISGSGLTLGENYACVITWRDSGGTEYVNTVRFDVVLEPYDGADVSIDDLVDEVADLRELLDAQAAAQAATTPRTAEQQASLIAGKAWEDVRRWIKAQLEQRGRIFPRLILDREAIRFVVVAQAVSRVYRAQGGGPESNSRGLADDWTKEAQTRLASLGDLPYDEDENRVEDSTVTLGGVVTVRRTW